MGAPNCAKARSTIRAATRDGEAQHELTSTRDGHPAWYFNRAVRVDTSIALTLRDVTELKAREQQMQSMALSDPLTLLHNRLWLDEYLPTAMQLARAESRMLALLMQGEAAQRRQGLRHEGLQQKTRSRA